MQFAPSRSKPARAPEQWVLDLSEAEEPIRAELFSAERLEQHAESLARAERPGSGRGVELAPRVTDNRRVLGRAYATLNRAAREQRALAPAAEWLLDNFHVIEEQVGDIITHLPRAYYRQLPKIGAGHLRGFPRVYGLAWAFVAHTDSRFSGELLARFVRAYQRVAPLQIGELWAVPIMLRIALLENLRRLSSALVRSQLGRRMADRIADGLGEDPAAFDPTHAMLAAGARTDASGISDPTGATTQGAPSRLPRRHRGDRCPACRARHQRGAAGGTRAGAPDRGRRHGAQHHHQHARDFGVRLAEPRSSR